MANLNWTGSVAQERIKMSSTGTVDTTVTATDPFTSATIYVPERFASSVIVDWQSYSGILTATRPCLFTVTLDNYADIIKGGLLTQWSAVLAYSQFTGYIVVFKEGSFEIGDTTIANEYLTTAFNATKHLGFHKYLYDPYYTGADVVVPESEGEKPTVTLQLLNITKNGTNATMDIVVVNKTTAQAQLAAKTYLVSDGSKNYVFTPSSATSLAAAGNGEVSVASAEIGNDESVVAGADITEKVTNKPVGLLAEITSVTPGEAASAGTKAVRNIEITTTSTTGIDVDAGTWSVSDHTSKTYTFVIDTTTTVSADNPLPVVATATVVGEDADWVETGKINNANITLSGTQLADNLTATQTSGTDGTEATAGSATTIGVTFTNGYHSALDISTYSTMTFESTGGYTYSLAGAAALGTLAAGGTATFSVTATTTGSDTYLSENANITSKISALDSDYFNAWCTNFSDGTASGDGSSVTIPAGTYAIPYTVTSGSAGVYNITIGTDSTLEAGSASSAYSIEGSIYGYDTTTEVETLANTDTTPNLPKGISVVISALDRGEDPVESETTKKSQFFDLNLALAQLVNNDGDGLSMHWVLVKTTFEDREPSSDDKCYLRYTSKGDEQALMTSLVSGDRAKYFWNALAGVMQVTKTWLCTTSETNSFYFADLWINKFSGGTNASGTYVGNSYAQCRMSGSRIKPYGYPSWVDSSVNENDSDGHDLLDSKKIGYLMSISSSYEQDCILSSAQSVSGLPVRMIEVLKYCDYTIRTQIADYISSKDRIASPLTLDATGYAAIQNMIMDIINAFASDGMITDLQWKFPTLENAKTTLSTSGVKGFALGNYCSGKFHENAGACSGTWDLTAV